MAVDEALTEKMAAAMLAMCHDALPQAAIDMPGHHARRNWTIPATYTLAWRSCGEK